MPGHLRDADGTEETGIVPVCIQRRKARLQSAPTGDLPARCCKPRLPGIYRSAVEKRAYRGFKSAVGNRAYRGVETGRSLLLGIYGGRGFKARLQTNAAARMLLQTLTLG